MEDRESWPHAPTHQLVDAGTYFVTASTYQKRHHFRGKDRVSVLHQGLLKVAAEFGWNLEAWAVFSNHYHFVAHSPGNAQNANSMSRMLGKLHSRTASWIRGLEGDENLQVWHNFRETLLTHRTSYFARLNYTHQNPAKHGLVPVANQYPWSSAAWYERSASPAMVKAVYRFKTDKISVDDEFEVSDKW